MVEIDTVDTMADESDYLEDWTLRSEVKNKELII